MVDDSEAGKQAVDGSVACERVVSLHVRGGARPKNKSSAVFPNLRAGDARASGQHIIFGISSAFKGTARLGKARQVALVLGHFLRRPSQAVPELWRGQSKAARGSTAAGGEDAPRTLWRRSEGEGRKNSDQRNCNQTTHHMDEEPEIDGYVSQEGAA